MPETLRLKLEHLQAKHHRRYLRWFTEGKKDGMCGLCKEDGQVPRRLREAYINGHRYGALSREYA